MNYFIFGFSLIIGVACIWASLRMLKLYFRVKKWDRVNAKVISKEVFVHEKYSSDRSPYGLRATYEYKFHNLPYMGSKIYLAELAGGQIDHMKGSAEKKLNSITAEMLVFVNPEKPEESVMYCKGAGLYIFVFVVGLISILVGVGHLF